MAINIIDTKAITEYLHQQADSDDRIGQWLNIALAKDLSKRKSSAVEIKSMPKDAPEWLVNKWDICGPFHEFKPDAALDDKVRHIKDWLISAGRNDELFLKDVNDNGIPKKLLSLNLESAYNAANKYFTRLNQKFRNAVEDDSDTKTMVTFLDGSRIVQLLTVNALKIEGSAMGHCIGGGGYDNSLKNGNCKFYSLRDPLNKPHATFHVEVDGNILRQCKGKNNEPPIQKYMPAVQEFVTQQQFGLRESASHTGLVQSDDGKYHSIYNLPENIFIPDSLTLDGCASLTSLPDNLSVKGDLSLRGCTGLTSLPDNLAVGHNLLLSYCTGLTALPDNIAVENNLCLDYCTGLTAIPRSIKVKGIIHDGFIMFTTVNEAADAFDKKYGRDKPTEAAAEFTHKPPP